MISLSIIIPVYNVEPYIRECLESCIRQSLKKTEIIVVNDATPDNSIKAIEDLINGNGNIRLINHESNKGHGGALNTGIANAKGEYIWFVDSDDFIDACSCEFLYNYAKQKDLDALGFGANNFYVNNTGRVFIDTDKYIYTGFVCDKLYNGKEFIYHAYCRYHRINTPQWAYIFRKAAIADYRFRENVSFEDNDGTPILLRGLEKISVLQYSPYYRRIHETNSIQYSGEADESKISRIIQQRLDIAAGLTDYIKQHRLKPKDPLAFFALRTFNTEIRPQYHELRSRVPANTHQERYNVVRKELYARTKLKSIFLYRLLFGFGVPAVYRHRYTDRKGFFRKCRYIAGRILKRK
ncbi:MAG: glycosyltransferase family 2 protein [Spirochaetales bacterium]|nr:glycosyltransferase family 2 protein [Spirochaetales bacterium]